MTHRVDENPSILTRMQRRASEDTQAEVPTRLERLKRFCSFRPEQNFKDEIEFLQKSLLEKDAIEIGSKSSSSSGYSNSSTIYGIINRLKAFIAEPHKDFNITERSFNQRHKQTFTNLIACLEVDARALQEAKEQLKENGDKHLIYEDQFEKRYVFRKNGRFFINLSEESKTATQLVLNKLFELKFEGIGLYDNIPLWSRDIYSEPPPILKILDKDLSALHSELVKFPPNDQLIIKHFRSVSRALSYPGELIPWYKPTADDRKIIEHFKQVFKAHIDMPTILKRDERFFPSYFNLNKEMFALKKMITSKISERTSKWNKLTKMASSAKDYAKESVKSPLNYLYNGIAEALASKAEGNLSINIEKPHPLSVFYETVKFFSKPSSVYTPERKLELLVEVLEECNDLFPDFEDSLAKELLKYITILSHGPDGQQMSQQEREHYAKVNLFHDLALLHETVLPNVISEKTQNLPVDTPLSTRLSFLTNGSIDVTSSDFSTSKGYLNTILDLIQNPSSEVMKAPIRFMIGNFNKFIQMAIDKALDSVKDSDREKLLGLKNTAKLCFDKALETNSLKEYKHSIQTFLDNYNQLQINLDCIELPTFCRDLQELKEDPQEIITETLAKSKNTNPIVEKELDWSIETQKQTKKLGESSTNFLLFNLIYYTILGQKENKETEKKYYRICAKLKGTRAERRRIFLKELKNEIDSSSSNFLRKMFARLIATEFLYETAYSRLNKFSKTSLEFIRENLENLESNPYEPINADIVQQVDECTAQYQLMLEKWAFEGGNKQNYIKKLLKKGDYNLGENRSYSQDDLYNELRKKTASTFSNGIDITEFLDPISKKYHEWVVKESYNSGSTISKIKSVTTKVFKYITVPLYFVTYWVSYSILSLLNLVVQFVSRRVVDHSLKKSNTIELLVESGQQAIYKKNPYVDIITDYLIDNLEDLDIALFEEDQERRKLITSGQVPHDIAENKKIPPKTRKALRQTLLNCFQLLEKNKHLTSDSLKKALKLKPQSALSDAKQMFSDSLDEIITPKVVDALIDVIAISSDVLFKKEHLEKQLGKLIGQVNSSLTEEDTLADESLEKLNQVYYQNELRLSKLMDKIIRKTVNLSINDEFDRFGDRYYRENENQKVWIQDKLLGDGTSEESGLIEKWKQLFTEIEGLNSQTSNLTLKQLDQQREKIKQVKEETETLLAEFSIKIEAAKESSLSKRSIEKLYSQLNVLAKNLQSYENDYLLKIFSNIENLYKLIQDKDNIQFLEKSSNSLIQHFDMLAETDDDEIAIQTIDDIRDVHLGISTTLDTLDEYGLSLRDNADFDEILEFFKSESWTEDYQSLFEEIEGKVLSRKLLQMIQPELDKLADEKKLDLAKEKSTFDFITKKFKKKEKNYWDNYYKILKVLEKIPNNTIYNNIKTSFLENIVKATNDDEVDSALSELQDYLLITTQNFDIDSDVESFKDLISPFQDNATKLLQEIKKRVESYNNEVIDLTNSSADTNVFAQLDELRDAAANMQSIEHIDIPVGVVKFLKEQTSALVYSTVKPKADEAIELLKDENIAKALVNYLVLIPLAEDRRR